MVMCECGCRAEGDGRMLIMMIGEFYRGLGIVCVCVVEREEGGSVCMDGGSQ